MFGPRSIRRPLLLLALAGGAAVPAAADTLLVGAGANPIPYSQVQVLRIESGSLYYMTPSGVEANKPLSDVQQISLDSDPVFTAAESAYRAQQWTDAADGYEKSLNVASNKDWVKDRSALRLMDAAVKAQRFDLAVSAFIALVSEDASWAGNKPALSADLPSGQIDDAATALSNAADNTNLSNKSRSAILSLLLDIDRFKKDLAGANQTIGRLADLGGASPDEVAGLKVAQAQAALDAKDFAKAQDLIQSARSGISDPVQQIDALFILAQCQDVLAANSDDANQIKDVALAYMRVATFGKDVPGRPHVPQALLRVAQIHEEKLKDEKPMALQLYTEIVNNYKDSPAAAQAASGVERLRKAS